MTAHLSVLGRIAIVAAACSIVVPPTARGAAQDGAPVSAPAPERDAKAHLAFADLSPIPDAPARRHEPPAALPERAARALTRANSLRAEKRYTEATIELEKALRYAPDDPRVHRLLALTQWESGEFQRVARHIEAALAAGKDDVVSHYLVGRLAARRFDNDAALGAFRLALRCAPDAATREIVALVEYHLAETLMAEGYLAAAIEIYERFDADLTALGDEALVSAELAALRSASPRTAPQRVASAHAELGQFDRAADSFARAFTGGAMRREDRRRYAELLLDAERIDEALDQARQVVTEDPAGVDLLRRIHTRRGAPADVITDLELLVKQHPHNVTLLLALADALQENGRSAEALQLLRKPADDLPQSTALRWALFDALVRQHDWPAALAEAASTIRTHPETASDATRRITELAAPMGDVDLPAATPQDGDYAGAFVWGILAQARGGSDEAIGFFERSVAANESFVPARVHLGRAHLERFAWDEAIAVVRPQTIALPDDTRLETILGKAHTGLSHPDRAIEDFRKAIRLNRSNVEAMLALAELYRDTGERERALRQLQTLVDVDSLNERARELLFHAYLSDGDPRAAARQLAELRRISASGTCIARCTAWMDFNPNAPDTERFRRTLEQAVDAYRPDAETLHLIALSLMQERRNTDSVDVLERAVALEPAHRASAELLVTAYRSELNFEQALDRRRLLISRYPNEAAWRADELELLLILQRFDEVVEVARTRRARPDLSDTEASELRETQLNAYLLGEDYDAALATLEAMWTEDPKQLFNLRRLIAVHQRAGNHGRALELIRRWPEEIAEGFAAGGTGMIWRALPEDQREEVLQLLLTAIERDPEQDTLQVSLIELLEVSDRFDEAIELAQASAAISRFKEAYQDLRLSVLNAAGRTDEAIALVRELLLAAPDDDFRAVIPPLGLRDRLVRLMIKAGDHSKASLKLNRWLEDADSKEERLFYLSLLGILHQEAQNQIEALQALELALEIDPDSPGSSNDLGYSLADAGVELERAEKLIRYAVADQPRNSAYLDSLGWVRYQRGDFAGAKLWLTRARFAGTGEDPVVCDHLGDACWRMGDKDAARKWWRQSAGFATERLEADWPMQADTRTLESVTAKLAAAESGADPKLAPLGTGVDSQ